MKGELANLVETLGQDAALKLIEAYGGTRVIVPSVKPSSHALLDVLGPESFDVLWKRYRGEVFGVPIARAWRIGIYAQQKMSRAEIARRIGCNENTVYVHLRGRKQTPGQFNFSFD